MDKEEIHTCAYCGKEAHYQLKNGKWCCQPHYNSCPTLRQKNSQSLKGHASWSKGIIPWNKGLTSKTDERLAKRTETIKAKYASGELKGSFLGRTETEEHRKKISESMRRAHAEGRAHNIGECRWNNEHSWPEKWFIKVIENEFTDKNYKCEVPFHRFSLDFAWIEKRKCIEIDGGFHDTEEQKKRDMEKDRLLIEEGWQVLRMPWKEVYKDTKVWIEKAKAFIDD